MGFCPGCGSEQPVVADGMPRFCYKCGGPLPAAAALLSSTPAGRPSSAGWRGPSSPQRRPEKSEHASPIRGRSPVRARSRGENRECSHREWSVPALRAPFATGGEMDSPAWRTTQQDAAVSGVVGQSSPPVISPRHESLQQRRQGRAVVRAYTRAEATREEIFPDALPQPPTPPGLRRRREERDRIRRGALDWGERVLKVTKRFRSGRNGFVLGDNLVVTEV
eukprot:Hpha_TRINITY_DN245_c0_g1::TRINITY_DN245_c0_g1_i1::g.83725::m.83725